MLTGMDLKGTPSHGNSIPLPTTLTESVIGIFHHLLVDGGLENTFAWSTGFGENNLPYMVCHVLLEDQGWSPDHPDQLLLSFILARASKMSRAESVMVCVMVTLNSKFNFEKKKKRWKMEPYTVTIVGTG